MPVFDPAHAPFVWAVYILAALLIGIMVLATALGARKAKRDQAAILKAQEETLT